MMIASTRAARVALLPLLAVLHGCVPSEDDPVEGPADVGRLVIVGGALDGGNAAVYEAILEAREGDGPVCVLPTASGEPRESMERAVATLSQHGGAGVAKGVLLTTDVPHRAFEPPVATELAACSGFFFTGGSQSRIVDVFLPAGDTTPAYRSLRRRWEEGAVVAGTSAGAAMMSRTMIAGGGSDEAVVRGVAAGPEDDGLDIRPGMGFLEPVVDQHFLARGRIGRLLVAVSRAETPPVGFGIDENTALVVDGDAAFVVGASGVVVVDGRSAEPKGRSGASGLRVTLAGAGDEIDLASYQVRRGAGKESLAVGAEGVDPPGDPFAPWAFLHLIAGLAESPATEVLVDVPGATLRIVEDAGFSASALGLDGGVEGAPRGFSAGPFRMDLTPGDR